ncbi:MAG TPA: nucleotidyltransferase family protein [Anaerolineales bacterium]|nr:nucleotidyltransferase family protein [Anaerolineales bacterium]
MISAIILAAGQSRRMGQPKMLLPWGNVSVLEHVISVFAAAGIEDILVITGAEQDQIEEAVARSANRYPVRVVRNSAFPHGEMLSSLQCGLRALRPTENTAAALIGLGDQPHVQERSVRLVCEAFLRTKSKLVVPSFEMRRGHPWLVARPLWQDLLTLQNPKSPRDFLNSHADDIHYVKVDTPSILADLDTPEDYRASHP